SAASAEAGAGGTTRVGIPDAARAASAPAPVLGRGTRLRRRGRAPGSFAAAGVARYSPRSDDGARTGAADRRLVRRRPARARLPRELGRQDALACDAAAAAAGATRGEGRVARRAWTGSRTGGGEGRPRHSGRRPD